MAAAALIALLVTALEAFSMMVPAFVALAVLVAAVMAFAVMSTLMAFPVMMVVVVAPGVGIIREPAFGQRPGRRVRGTAHAAVELDPGLGQRALRAHADPAADQRVRLRGLQKAGQRAVTAAAGGHDLFRDDPAVLRVVELELLRVAEMLEDLSVFVSYCNSHSI